MRDSLTLGNTEGRWRGGATRRVGGLGGQEDGDNWVTGIKEGIGCDEHWVLYATNELLKTSSETNDVLHVGKLNLDKIFKLKKKDTIGIKGISHNFISIEKKNLFSFSVNIRLLKKYQD